MHAVLVAAEESAGGVSHAAIAPEVVGLLAFGILVSLLLVTYAFRSVGQRNLDRAH